MRRSAAVLLLCTVSVFGAWTAPKVTTASAIALRGEPKYKPGFTHFDYVNPDAPKGGTLVQAAMGSFDNFNRYAQRGVADALATAYYDTLMVGSDDEIAVYYPLIAESVEYPDDDSWIVFKINPKARFQDGKPIRAADAAYSFDLFMTKGVPQFKQYYKGVKCEVLDEGRVKFTLPEPNRELLLSLCGLTILPKQFWTGKDFSEPLNAPPLGSGAYTAKDFKMGQYVVYERIKDYWAADLPVNKGRMNFDYLRYDYYRDASVAFEAFKAEAYDLRVESIALNWATKYVGPAFDSKRILKEEIPHEIAQGMSAFVFNIKRPIFADRRVREALNLMLDFEWMNKNLFYGQYARTRSYFQNTKYAATGLPGPAELKILEKIKDKIPPEVFAKEFQPSKTDGSGNVRDQSRQALALLKAAGWELKDGKLLDKAGKPFEFEILNYDPSYERVEIPFQKNLERIGVVLKIRTIDSAQFTKRLRDRDYDMIYNGYGAQDYPGLDMRQAWRSNYLDYTYNSAGVQDPAIDYLIDGIEASQKDDAALLAWGRAFDRVATWNYYVVPTWHLSKFRVAFQDKFGRPALRPKYTLGDDTWWMDAKKEAALKASASKKTK